MVIYLSGPISLDGKASAEQIAENILRFHDTAKLLREETHEVLSPAELDKQDSWADYMRHCIPMVCQADLVLVLPGWGLSRGSVFEVLVAQTIGVPVLPVHDFLTAAAELAS